MVASPPTILTSPRTHTAVVGWSLDLTVSARGSFPLTYQWFFNGSAILGASNADLHLTNLQFSQSGTYTVTVTNALGAVTSAPAVLTVIAVPSNPPAGTVVAWGDNTYDQTEVPAGLSGVIAVAAGYNRSLALKSEGTVVAWGMIPANGSWAPANLSGVIALAVGEMHGLALRSDGTVVAWGDNSDGQTDVPASLSNVLAIAAGGFHSLAVQSDRTVIAWGWEYDYDVAGSFAGQSTVPPGLSGVTAVAGGMCHSLALKSDGTVIAWGSNKDYFGNYAGQSVVPEGLSGVIGITAGSFHSLALRSDGTVVAWGSNVFGQSEVPAGLSGVVGIAAGERHSLALKSDGTVVAWGCTCYGVTNVPAGLRGVIAIAAGESHSLALVSGPPSVLTPPADQTAEIGSTVQLRVRGGGFPVLAYQWFFNGTTALGGATNSVLQLADVQSSQSGAYTVVVTNIAGAATSAPAMLSVIPVVERRMVPALTLMGQPGSSLNLQDAGALGPSPSWVTFDNVALTNTSQWYFDLSAPLPPQRFYRAWQPGPSGVAPTLDLHIVPALTLTGAVGSTVRVDYINQFGPTDAWVTLDTVTLTNTSQLYFDVSAIGQPPRLWRLVPVP